MWYPRELTTEQRTNVSLRLSSRFAVLGAFGPSPFGQMPLCPQMYLIQSSAVGKCLGDAAHMLVAYTRVGQVSRKRSPYAGCIPCGEMVTEELSPYTGRIHLWWASV